MSSENVIGLMKSVMFFVTPRIGVIRNMYNDVVSGAGKIELC